MNSLLKWGIFHIYVSLMNLYEGTPIAGWFTAENPTIKWMFWGNYPDFRNPPDIVTRG